MDTTKTTTHLSLCAGYGGIDLGLGRAIRNLRTIAYAEIEAFACANLVAKIEGGELDAAPVWTDLKTFPWEAFRNRVGILSGGFPCQPFSAAGKRGADKDPRHLFPHILRGIEICGPNLVFLENVEGLISARLSGVGWRDPEGTPVLLHVLRELERVGYSATAGVFSAAEVGAPHQRKRVFILAYSNRSGSGQDLLRSELRAGGTLESPGHPRLLLHEGKTREVQIWPSRPGERQQAWEPPRVVANTVRSNKARREPARREEESGRAHGEPRGSSPFLREVESEVGGDLDGLAYRVDDAGLYTSCDSRADELRLLGNGVVPATAERAFRVLSSRLICL